MIEDKLERSERVRLEAVAQANASFGMRGCDKVEDLVNRADAIAEFINKGKESKHDG